VKTEYIGDGLVLISEGSVEEVKKCRDELKSAIRNGYLEEEKKKDPQGHWLPSLRRRNAKIKK